MSIDNSIKNDELKLIPVTKINEWDDDIQVANCNGCYYKSNNGCLHEDWLDFSLNGNSPCILNGKPAIFIKTGMTPKFIHPIFSDFIGIHQLYDGERYDLLMKNKSMKIAYWSSKHEMFCNRFGSPEFSHTNVIKFSHSPTPKVI